MMMMFVVTPSLNSIEHKFNSKSIKFPKLHKVPTLEAININKPWSEWKERLRNFGVKPPKRGIELGWVTRGTRPKKPSSSRGFAREARGARGSWGLKTETEHFFPLFSSRQLPKKINFFYFLFLFLFFSCVCADASARPRKAKGAKGGRGQGGELVRADAPMSARTHGRIRTDALVSARTQGCIHADAFFTVDTDGKNPSAG
jgi:hypothetical protein